MAETVYDKTLPGGLYLIEGRTVDANGKPLDLPAGAASIGDTGADDAARAAAAAAEAERAAREAAQEEAGSEDELAAFVAQAAALSVPDLPALLSTIDDAALLAEMAEADQRVTAAAKYSARLAELAPVEG